MRLFSIIFTCFTLMAGTSFAMGSKSNPVQSTDTAPTASKIELGKKVAAAKMTASLPADLFSKIAKPFQDELKKSWNVDAAFSNTVTQFDGQNEALLKPFLKFAEDIIAKAYAAKYTESELKELVKIYESPLMQKEAEALWGWMTDELIRAMKDPKIWQEYTQQFTGIFTALLIAGMQSAAVTNQLLTSLSTDTTKAMSDTKIDFNTEEGRKTFRDKFVKTYPSLAGFTPMVEKAIMDSTNILSEMNALLPGLAQ